MHSYGSGYVEKQHFGAENLLHGVLYRLHAEKHCSFCARRLQALVGTFVDIHHKMLSGSLADPLIILHAERSRKDVSLELWVRVDYSHVLLYAARTAVGVRSSQAVVASEKARSSTGKRNKEVNEKRGRGKGRRVPPHSHHTLTPERSSSDALLIERGSP